LGLLAGVVDEDVCIGSHACYGADHVAEAEVSFRFEYGGPGTYSFRIYSFSADVSCSRSLLVTFLSAANTMPSFANMPNAVPAWEMASRAYST